MCVKSSCPLMQICIKNDAVFTRSSPSSECDTNEWIMMDAFHCLIANTANISIHNIFIYCIELIY